ncbi:MAG: HEAT repeat domain-containing protein [Nitrospirales bacterium]|nr:HEAT repeat domain-containing protein [Nitrospira sp.]MBA3966379.1 HEAT repeat domain-containing protein [Nitrospirales bacterium]
MQWNAGASGTRKGSGSMALAVLSGALWCLWPPAVSARSLNDAQTAFDKKQYQEALDLIEQVVKEKGPQPETRRLKIRSLVQVGKPKDALAEYEHLEQGLTSDDPVLLKTVALGFVTVLVKDMREQMRGAAYTALKDVDSPETIPFLEDGLSDGSGLVRALAAEALGKLEAGRRSPRLRNALEDQAGLVKATVLKVLGKSGDRSVIPLLERALTDEQPVVRLAAAGALYHTGQTAMWETVRQAALAQNPEERATALRLVGELKDARGLAILLEAVTHTQPSVRGAAASGLGDLGKVQGIPALEHALQDKIAAVKTSAAISLGELGMKDSLVALKNALADPNPVVKAAVVSALLRAGEPFEAVGPELYELAQNHDPGTRSAAGKAVGRAHGPNAKPAIEFLSGMLKDPIPRPRIAAARALGHIGGVEVLPILKEALHDEDDAVRATAGGAIARVLHHTKRLSRHAKS